MTIIATRTKSATEVVSYTIDWDALDFLGSDTIASSSWTATTGLTIDSDSNTTTTATAVVSGGTAQTAYTLTNQITLTTSGDTRERSIVVYVGVDTPASEGEYFTYDIDTDLGKVRFWLRDVESTKALWSDSEINYRLTANASETNAVYSTVIELMVLKLAEFENPEYVADWLEEREMKEAAEVLQMRLKELRRLFGVKQISSTAKRIYRADSLQTSEPDYSDGADDATLSQVET